MAHCTTGIIAKEQVVKELSAQFGLHKPIALSQGFALLPLRKSDIGSFISTGLKDYAEGFEYLSSKLSDCLTKASLAGAILYFETEYFGGVGTQGAAVYENGICIMLPTTAEYGPINKGLALLGVEILSDKNDEFASIGLDKYRLTEDWILFADSGS
jgi:hypothetical protein